jgi:hypothetical protein
LVNGQKNFDVSDASVKLVFVLKKYFLSGTRSLVIGHVFMYFLTKCMKTVMINMLNIIFCQAFYLVSMQVVTVSVTFTSENKVDYSGF